ETAGLLADVDALETTVGDGTAGLVKDVADLKTAVGDETDGIVKDINDLQAKVAANQAESTATQVAGLVADFNTLLASLKAAGLMVEDAQG
ncbi:MAG TPA: head fiber protein, partial [Bacillota bacterium]|nr:head fiber protein [Bacillota bacterium]